MAHYRFGLHLISALMLAAVATLSQAAEESGSYQVTITAADMCCKGCAKKVAGQLYAAPGVSDVKANVETRSVVVTVSRRGGASLAQLWNAVEAAKGGPTALAVPEATFTLTPADKQNAMPATTSHVIVDRLDQQDRAQKIANGLYAIRGVQKVNFDREQNALVVTSEAAMSPWALIGAVTNVQERPAAIVGSYGQLDIAWSADGSAVRNQQAQQLNEGVQR